MSDEIKLPEDLLAIEKRGMQAIAATASYMEIMTRLGMPALVLGFPFNTSTDGLGVVKIMGDSTLVLNLISGLVAQLVPEDFLRLRVAMAHSDYFAKQRAVADAPPTPPSKVN